MLKKWMTIIFSDQENDAKKSSLQRSIEQELPGKEENDYIHATCLSGLMARVAYVDFNIHADEQIYMEKALSDWLDFKPESIKAITKIALEHVVELSGTQNHYYCNPLIDLLDAHERHQIIKLLFQLAASDGQVTSDENEEIRSINQCLRLSDKHFVAARVDILEKLSINN